MSPNAMNFASNAGWTVIDRDGKYSPTLGRVIPVVTRPYPRELLIRFDYHRRQIHWVADGDTIHTETVQETP